MRLFALAAALSALTLPASALAQAAVPGPAREIAYGSAPLQTLDFYAAPPSREPAPLIVFVHGGGWSRGDKGNATGSEKIAHYHAQGYAFATINYRLVPGATVAQQADDVALALARLIGQAGALGFDPRRVVLMGHSAGAHLSALVGTDPAYLRKAGLSQSALRGVVLLDGAAYDVPAQMTQAGRYMLGRYTQAFGTDAAAQRLVSPITHAAAPNAPRFLILHVDRDDGARQSEALAEALRAAGTPVTLQAFEGRGLRGHVAMNRRLGDPEYPATAVVDRWLSETLSR